MLKVISRMRAPFGAVVFGGLCLGAAQAQDLSSFAVLAGSAVTNTGPTVIDGNLGVGPGSSITGFPPGVVNDPFAIHDNDAVAALAQDQLTTAYNILAGRPFTSDLTGQDLVGQTLIGGVYNFDGAAGLSGTLTLDGQGDPNAIFIFNIDTTLTTSSGAQILLINDANTANVFFRVGSSATLGAGTIFKGKIIALTSITLVTGTTINCGAALARNGAVTLDTNTIGICEVAPVSISDGLDDTANETDTELAEALDDYVTNGGVLPIGFEVLALLTPAELAVALSQLSGEVASGAAPTAGQAMGSFLDQMGARRRVASGASPMSSDDAERGTVSVMGYAADAPDPADGAFADFGTGTVIPDVGGWDVWTGSYGGLSLTEGDASGSHDRGAAAFGLTFGFEREREPGQMFGLALSGGGTAFSLDDNTGSGHSAMAQIGAYGSAESGNGYLTAAFAYGIHDMHTDRHVTFAGDDHFTAQFLMQDVAADIEAGYDMGWLTPFARLRGQIISTPAYEEETVSGSSTYALGYDANVALMASTQIGARAEWSADREASTITLHASAAWEHSFASDNSKTASFLALPGSEFSTGGATGASDAALVSVGADMTLKSGLTLSGELGGGFSETTQVYSGGLSLSTSW